MDKEENDIQFIELEKGTVSGTPKGPVTAK